VRAFAKNVQQANLVIYGAFSAYVLPVAYAVEVFFSFLDAFLETLKKVHS
jgi:hypothetical protein